MIKVLSNEPSTVYYSDVKVGESFIYPNDKYAIYIRIKDICYTAHNFKGNNVAHEATCVNIATGELEDFCHDDEVYLVNCTVKWEYDSKDKKNK